MRFAVRIWDDERISDFATNYHRLTSEIFGGGGGQQMLYSGFSRSNIGSCTKMADL